MEERYQISGVVAHGKGNGHTVGMPTANLPCPAGQAQPPFGVYASWVTVDGKAYMGVTNVGTRPSIDSDPRPTVETCLLDFSGDLYGKSITVTLCRYIRPTVKMRSLAEVKAQVEKDAQTARILLSKQDVGADSVLFFSNSDSG